MLRSRVLIALGAVAALALLGGAVAAGLLGHPGGAGPRTGSASPSPSPVAPAAPSGTGTPAPVPGASGSEEFTLVSGGIARTYRVHTPAGLPPEAPLVVMLHGGGGSAAVAEQYYGWDQEADREKFVVAYPDGLGPVEPAWNTGGGCCGYPARNDIDDVRFIQDMVAAIGSRIPLDDRRIYAAGISNGGIMAYTLACRTDLFAAIGPDSATMLGTCETPAPTSVIHIHGLQDTTIPFDGGTGAGPAAIDGPPVPAVIDQWRVVDRCAPATSTTAGVVTTAVGTCAEGRAVELVTIADGGHGWPGSPVKAGRSTAGGNQPSEALDATGTIWRFFAAHPKP